MKIKYLKKLQFYDDYHASRVIWIRTLKKELLFKCSILGQTENVVYKVTDQTEDKPYIITENVLTREEIKRINDLLTHNYRDFEWDYEDEEGIDGMLGFFGEILARRHWLERDSSKMDGVIADYIFDSSEEINYEELTKTAFFKKEATEDEIIERYLLPELVERETLDMMQVHIARGGRVNSYLVTIQGYE